MSFLVWLIVGGVVGWLASIVMRTEGEAGVTLNVLVGIFGAFSGGSFLAPLTGAGDMMIVSTICALIGAIILVAAVNLFRRGHKRSGHDQT